MKPLVHPHIDEITVEGILHALADPVRVSIFAQLVGQECTRNCSGFLHVGERLLPKSTLSQHFRVLREAGLVCGEKRGVEVLHVPRCAEVETRFPGLLSAIVTAYDRQAAAHKRSSRRQAKHSQQRASA